MKIRETVEHARENAARRMTESKPDRVAEENQELKTENRLLRDELAESRSEREHMLDLLDRLETSSGRPHKRFRVLRLVAVGGAVYAVATKTGAMDRIKGWMSSMSGKTEQMTSEVASGVADAARQVGDKAHQVGDRSHEVGDAVDPKTP